MIFNVFIATCSVFFIIGRASADSDNDVKRGQYPYMAFLYYPHLIPKYGPIQDAILLKPEWLLSAALDPIVTDKEEKTEDDIFPLKTLMARVGALEVDPKVTFNEDEDEQEREVIQVVRPKNHNPEKRWLTDISLLKTLLPFKINAVVKVAPLFTGRKAEAERVCTVLIYMSPASDTNNTGNKILTEHSVELLPAKKETCGNEFLSHNVMVCATDSKEAAKTNTMKDDFCHINSGGPLICDDQVLGIQTYINNTCSPPYLYQLISGWEESFINCGTSEKCSEEFCAKYCVATQKDEEPKTVKTTEVSKVDSSTVSEVTLEAESEKSVELSSTAKTEAQAIVSEEPVVSSEASTTVSTTTTTESEPLDNIQKVPVRRDGDPKRDGPSASVLLLEAENDRKIQVLNKTKVKLVSNAEGKYVSALMGLPIIIVNLIAAI